MDSRPGAEAALKTISASAFLIFFQSYLVAPLIPAFSAEFKASEQVVGLLVPAYLLPYGFSTLFYGPLSDRLGRRPILLVLLFLLILTTSASGFAHSTSELMGCRILGGLIAGGIIPIGLALLADLFPYESRGRAMGWVFGAIAGGMAFGSTLGAFLNPIIGWRAEFFITGFFSALVFVFAFAHRSAFENNLRTSLTGFAATFSGYFLILSNSRAFKSYFYIFLNGMFHSGVFSWLGLYFANRYQLGDRGIGLALLGYGVPGMLLGPLIGRIADRTGRRKIIPFGMFVAALSAALLVLHLPLIFAALVTTVLSLGYDMTHPLLVGIISTLDPKRRGQAMGLNAFFLFTGFGFGTLAFQLLLRSGFSFALLIFSALQVLLAIAAFPSFRDEHPAIAHS